MKIRLSAGRRLGIVLLLVLGAASAAEAKSYVAERFDVRGELMRGGSLRVTETLVLRFDSGTFSEVTREISGRSSDGLEFVSASMDGQPMPRGSEPGQVDVRRGDRLRIKWRFARRSNSTHTFTLDYVIHGAVRRGEGEDVFAWRALPGKHDYRIESSRIDLLLPATPLDAPAITHRRAEHVRTSTEGPSVRVLADAIRSNGWVEASVRMPLGSAIAAGPAWQLRQERHRASAPFWALAAAAAFFTGLVVLFAIRQGYDSPPRDTAPASTVTTAPDTLTPAEAGALVANGSPRLEHAMATLFALAERGELTIVEEPRRFGQHRFTVVRRAARRPVAPYEQAVLDAVFSKGGETEERVTLDKARSRLAGHLKPFGRALETELDARGLIDHGRKQIRDRYAVVSLAMFGLSMIVLVAGLVALRRFDQGPWPLVVGLAIAIAAIVALVCHAAHTPLSNDGVRRARAWRAFVAHLKEVADDRAAINAAAAAPLLPFAVALGIASQWAKYLKAHRVAMPAWFHAGADTDGSAAFVAFVAHGGASASGGAPGGGVVGGGSSGAR
jgi:hypothetical protein